MLAAAPFLGQIRSAHAQSAPTRFIAFMSAHDNAWRSIWDPGVSSGSPLPSSLPNYLGVLDPYIDRTTMIADLRGTKSESGTHEQWGVMLTGRDAVNPGDSQRASGPSIDQVIAERHSQNPLVIGYQANETPSELRNYCSWADARLGNAAVLPHEAFDEVFGGGLPPTSGTGTMPNPDQVARQRRRRSVLDFIAGEIESTRQILPAADRFVLDAHLDGIRDLERRLMDETPNLVGGSGCEAPGVDNISYGIESSRGRQFPLLVELSNAVAVMTVRCDLRRSLVLQYGSCANHFIYPRWPDNKYHPVDITRNPNAQTNNNWHSIAHTLRSDNQSIPDKIDMERFMMRVFKETLDGLDEFQETADATHLDNSVCLWMRAMGVGHDRTSDRFALIFGKGGGRLRGNLYHDTGGDEDNDVLVTCLQACGFDDNTFGEAGLCHGAYPVLTGA